MERKIIGLCLVMLISMSCQEGEKSSPTEVNSLIEEGRFIKAAEELLKIPALADGKQAQKQEIEKIDIEALFKTAQFFSESGQSEKAVELLEKLVAADPENIAGRLLLANNLRNSKQDDNRVIQLYNELADIDSVRFIVLPERARLYIRLDEFKRAESDISEGKSLQPKYFANFLADGLLQYSQGYMDQALDLFEIAENLDPGVSAEASLFAGYILLSNNLNYDALGKFTRAIDVGKNINKGYAYINRGVCQINLQDTSFACHDWDSAFKYMPNDAKRYIDDYCMKSMKNLKK
jgi:tetratricopeptide (TPR) repeat protein